MWTTSTNLGTMKLTLSYLRCSIRSSSILFLPAESRAGGEPSRSFTKDLTSPYLSGFEFSRSGNDSNEHDSYEEHYARQRTVTEARKAIKLDNYHHPRKRYDATIYYRQVLDVYSYVAGPFSHSVNTTVPH
jgi:hypothetical protein